MNALEVNGAQSLNTCHGQSGRIPRRLRTGRLFSIAFSVLALVLVLTCSASAQSALTDDADTHNGNTSNLTLSPGSNVYLKFKLSSTLPSGTPGSGVSKATVKLYLGAVKSPGALDVRQLDSNWGEKTVASAPPALGVVLQAGVPVQSDQEGKFLVVDVTAAVQQWLGTDGSGAGGVPNYGVALVARDGASVTFDSKENSQTSHEAQLNVQLKLGAGTVTGVSADSPLTVTDPTTAPHISLGVVPTDKGGTGLSSPGASGNFLRSDGGAWTSGPLAAPDIPAGSAHYIQNSTSRQSSSNFNIGGTGAADTFNAATQYDLGGERILGNAGTNNVFAGVGAGAVNTGSENAFFGRNAGFSNTTGSNNSFFGNTAGGRNTTGGGNSFFGSFAGSFNTTGDRNSFFGAGAGNFNTGGADNSFFGSDAGAGNTSGESNSFFGSFAGFKGTTGGFNSFFGKGAGFGNQTGGGNSFFGTSAGFNNTTGQLNAFFGEGTGSANTSGTGNTFIGRDADFDAPGATGDNNTLLGLNTRVVSGVNNATAIGARARVTQSNALVLGGISGVNGGTSINVGIGTTAPKARLDVTGGNILVGSPGQGLILKSPDGASCRLLSIDNAGSLTLAAVACP